MKKILSIAIVQAADDASSTADSLGRYTDKPGNEWAINREARGDMLNSEYRYWTPEPNNVIGMAEEDRTTCIEQDYLRCEAHGRGEWSYIGVYAEAVIRLGVNQDLCQNIQSGGSWGNASDESPGYLATIAGDQLSELRGELLAIGFTVSDIAKAVETLKRKAA